MALPSPLSTPQNIISAPGNPSAMAKPLRVFLLFRAVPVRQYPPVRKVWVISLLLVCFGMSLANAATYSLTTGETVVGELLLSSANDVGIQIKLGDGEYKRFPWSSFSQEDLKKLSSNAKLQPFVEPFIEVTQEERLKKTDVNPVPPDRLDLPAKKSLFAAMFSSGLGIAILLLLYAANIYAGYEISIYRVKPALLVCGVAAVLPLIGPLIFLAMPTKVQPVDEQPAPESAPTEGEAIAAAGAPAEGQDDTNPMRAEGAAHPTSLHISHEAPQKKAAPKEAVFQRGQFTFNRRFFETRFSGFFGAVRRDADKDTVLVFKTAKGEFVGERITRVSANDLHLEVRKGQALEEVTIAFNEVQEIRHKHKSA